MQFNSYLYVFLFLPLVLVLYSLLRTRPVANKLMLLLASCVFYGCFAPIFLVPLLLSGVFDFYIALRIAKGNERLRLWMLYLSCAINLGMLAFFKYTNWLTGIANSIAVYYGYSIPVMNIPLPPGISFYTFQTLAYIIAVYQMRFAPTSSFLDYMCYIMFFPQLVAGPISRAGQLLPQLAAVRPPVSGADASGAIFLILLGLFKKTVLADNFGGVAEFVNDAMKGSGGKASPGLGLLFAYAFAGQIYCDFSAYSDIAIGSAKLFNIELMKNFATPYFSTNPAEFWSRWHISLSTWLREYLFTPLCFWLPGDGKRGKRIHILLAMAITLTLCGIWHGAGLMFLLWGLFHAILYTMYFLWPVDRALKGWLGWIGHVVSLVLFFHLVCFGWLLFRAQSLGHLGTILTSLWQTKVMVGKGMLSQAWVTQHWIFWVMSWWLLLLFIATLAADVAERRGGGDVRKFFLRLPSPLAALTIVSLFYGIVFFGRRVANEFIYFAF